MAKKQEEYHCTVQITEGFEDRFTAALVDLYYKRKEQGLLPSPEELKKYKCNGTA